MAEFVLISGGSKATAINPQHVSRAEWQVAADGRDGCILIHMADGSIQSVAFGDPLVKTAAESFGFGPLLAAWPKAKAEAEAKWNKQQAEAKAALEQRRKLLRVA